MQSRENARLHVGGIILNMDNKIWQQEWNKFGKLENIDDLKMYFQIDREFRHSYYFHYTSSDVIKSIFNNHKIWISNVGRFNDHNDREQFNTPYFFSLCFSTGVNENLPLWYMYSGMNGQGGRLGIKKSAIKGFIGIDGSVKYTLHELETDGNGKVTGLKPNTDIILKKDVDFSLRFKDVLYYQHSDEKGTVDIKYNTMTNYNISKIEFEEYKKENIGFFKSLVWYYEKETRLLIELVGNIRERIDPNKKYVITLDINEDILKHISVTFAPEIKDAQREKTENELRELYPDLRIEKSRYHGTVTMNFCSKCSERNKK